MAEKHNSHFYEQMAEKFLKTSTGTFAIAVLLVSLMPRESSKLNLSLYLVSHAALFVICFLRFIVLYYFLKNKRKLDWTLTTVATRRLYYLIVGLAWSGALAIGLMTIGSYLEYGLFSPNSVVMSLTCAAFTMLGAHNIAFNYKTVAGYNFFVLSPSLVYMGYFGVAENVGYWLALILFFVMCTGQVISNRKVMLEYLRTSDLNLIQVQYYRLILDSVPGLITVFSKDLQYQLVNSKVAAFTGLADIEIVGSQLGFRWQDSEFRAVVETFQKSDIESQSRRIQMTSKGKKFWFMMVLQRIRKTGQIVVVSIDINEQVMAEEQALEQRSIIQSSAQLAAIGELAAGIAHEINNPLAIITSKAEQALRSTKRFVVEPKVQSEIISYIEKIKETAFRIARIVKGLRALARDGENDDFSEIKLSDLLVDVRVLLEEKLRTNGVDLKLNFSPELILDCRVTQLSQVLLNLISNSIDAIKTREDKWVLVEALSDENSTLIMVTDAGDGISEAVATKIMTPFFTTKAAGVGTGLGLSIAKRILADHGGELYYDKKCKNTRFCVRLPQRIQSRLVS